MACGWEVQLTGIMVVERHIYYVGQRNICLYIHIYLQLQIEMKHDKKMEKNKSIERMETLFLLFSRL